ncbi:hypothetical protein JD844_011402 [Phrynosoma platyrhinos]|uniref:Uncharacterized protein n=1 Tax=Phrynosoma platyrhinos TaxID=52577 RepID=A0ABQ7THX7_PHRPL|nr:hypothetical protein JD844_011402 [Phrynosoma platyrhinos]
MEIQDTLAADLSSASSSLDHSLSPENITPEGRQILTDKLTKADTEFVDDDRDLMDRNPLGTDQSSKSVTENHGDFQAKLAQSGKNGVDNQHASVIVTVEKMEEESSKKDKPTGSSKEQSEINSVATDQSLENTLNTQTLVTDGVPISEEVGQNISSDLLFNIESSEIKNAKLSSGEQNLGTKESESEMGQSCKTNIEQVAKQEDSVPVPKKVKMEGVSKAGRLCEKEKKSTPTEGSEKKGKTPLTNQKQQQTKQKAKKQQENNKVNEVKQSHVYPVDGIMVYFHAILSKDFKLDPGKHKIFIRAQGVPGFKNWAENICELHCTK